MYFLVYIFFVFVFHCLHKIKNQIAFVWLSSKVFLPKHNLNSAVCSFSETLYESQQLHKSNLRLYTTCWRLLYRDANVSYLGTQEHWQVVVHTQEKQEDQHLEDMTQSDQLMCLNHQFWDQDWKYHGSTWFWPKKHQQVELNDLSSSWWTNMYVSKFLTLTCRCWAPPSGRSIFKAALKSWLFTLCRLEANSRAGAWGTGNSDWPFTKLSPGEKYKLTHCETTCTGTQIDSDRD